jgi:hypothetical protein
VKLFLILVLHLRQFFIVSIFVKRATGCYLGLSPLFPIATVLHVIFSKQDIHMLDIS